MVKLSKFFIIFLIAALVLILGWYLSNTFEWATIAQGLNPHRSEQLRHEFSKLSDKRLLHELYNEDFGKRDAAASVIFSRKNLNVFSELEVMSHAKQAYVREIARSLMQMDPGKAKPIYMNELKKTNPLKMEYRQLLTLLVKYNDPDLRPFLKNFVRDDIDNNRTSTDLVKEYGDPTLISDLEEMLANSPNISKFEKKRVLEVIDYLQNISRTSAS